MSLFLSHFWSLLCAKFAFVLGLVMGLWEPLYPYLKQASFWGLHCELLYKQERLSLFWE